MTKTKQEQTEYVVMLIAAAVFIILKMIRGFTISEEEGGIWNIIQLFFIGTGCLSLLSKNREHNSFHCIRLYIILSLFIWFLSFFPFWFSRMTLGQVFHFLTVPYGMMVLVSFFSIGKKRPIKTHSEILSISFIVISGVLFFAMRSYLVRIGAVGALADVYYIVALLPLMFVYTPQKFAIIPFLIAMVCVAMTGKRGAFVALMAVFAIYFVFPNNNAKSKNSNLIIRIIALLVLSAFVYYVLVRFVWRYNLSIFDRFDTLEEDGGSGRLSRWKRIITFIDSDATVFHFLFGHGSNYTLKMIGGHAHNDFLEFLMDYGLFALILYVSFFVSLFKEGLRMYKAKYRYSREYMCSVIIAFCMASYSFYAIDCTHITCSSICQGLILADWYKYKGNGYQYAC